MGCRVGCARFKVPSDISWHCFPKRDPDLRQKWLDIVPLKGSKVSEHTRICSLHFKREDYKPGSSDTNSTRNQAKKSRALALTILKADALPSVHLTGE